MVLVLAISMGLASELVDDFSTQNSNWKSYKGEWVFRDNIVVQNSIKDYFPLILWEGKSFDDIDISVDFRPISGLIDASGGVVFRAVDKDNYYIVRANALEDNFRLYTFKDGIRSQIATATVTPPSIGKFHKIRVVAKGDSIKAYLDGKLLIDHKDSSFKSGYIGLWTKADSITEFDNLELSK